MTRPRILIFSVAYLPFVGGAEVAVKEITDRLSASRRFDFDLLTVNLDGKQKPEERLGPVMVFRLGRGKIAKYFFPWTACWLAKKLHRKHPYNAVWAIMANQAGLAAVNFKRRFSEIPLLLTLQEGDDLKAVERKVRFIKSWWRGVFRRADFVQAISHYLAEWGRQMGAKCPITVVPNGVDLEKFKAQSEKRKTTAQSEKVIITTSRLVEKNGVDTLIEAMRFLPDNVKLQIVGSGPLEHELRFQVSSFKLQARVEFIGSVSPESIPEYLGQADVFVRPSRSEGLGNSFLEAMAAGLPTIGTPVGGIPDFLKEGETGWLVPVNDPKSIAEKVKYILDPANRDLVNRVVQTAKHLVVDKYGWAKIAAQISVIFSQLFDACLAESRKIDRVCQW